MDDYLHFVEAHSLYLFRGGVLSSRVREAWGLLRIVVLHYFRALTVEHDTFPFTQEACQRAEKAMLDFAKLMEEVSLHTSEPAHHWLPTCQQGFNVHHCFLGSCQRTPQSTGA